MWVVRWNSCDVVVYILALWKLCGFLWDCLWASGGLPVASPHLIENGGSLRHRIVLWVWSGPFLPI